MNCRNARENLVRTGQFGVRLNYRSVLAHILESLEPQACDHRARRPEAGRIGAFAADPRRWPAVAGLIPQPRLWSGIPEEVEDAELAAVSRRRAMRTA